MSRPKKPTGFSLLRRDELAEIFASALEYLPTCHAASDASYLLFPIEANHYRIPRKPDENPFRDYPPKTDGTLSQAERESIEEMAARRLFNDVFWTPAQAYAWIAFRNSNALERNFRAALLHDEQSLVERDPVGMLLRAVQGGEVTAIKNGRETASEEWALTTSMAPYPDVRFRRDDILKRWPLFNFPVISSDSQGTATAANAAAEGLGEPDMANGAAEAKSPAGAKPKWDWEDIGLFVNKTLCQNEDFDDPKHQVPGWRSQNDLIEKVKDYLETRRHDLPAPSTLKSRIGPMVSKWRAGRE
ncbi:MAG: hypothetical protein U1E81_08130 [Xanthobacteraceae bacterium]